MLFLLNIIPLFNHSFRDIKISSDWWYRIKPIRIDKSKDYWHVSISNLFVLFFCLGKQHENLFSLFGRSFWNFAFQPQISNCPSLSRLLKASQGPCYSLLYPTFPIPTTSKTKLCFQFDQNTIYLYFLSTRKAISFP